MATLTAARSTPHPAVPQLAAPPPRPFLKWAGGKAQLLPELRRRVPAGIKTYFEPLLGGGALLFALLSDSVRRPRRVVLNDVNADLIATYQVLRDTPDQLVQRLVALEAEYLAAGAEARAEMFYRVRAERPQALPIGSQAPSSIEVAARVIFLNKTCFNGLYRVNRKGEFNVPHGRYATPRICDRETLLAASEALQGAELRHTDFEEACADARVGDFVYLDPPFHPLSATASFTAYTEGSFGIAEQIRLKHYIDALTARGIAVMLSNSPHPDIRGGYLLSGYRVEQVPARRAINARGDRRGPVGELIVTNEALRTATMPA